MSQQEFGLSTVRLNDPSFPTRTPDRGETLLHWDTRAIIYAGSSTKPDALVDTADRIKFEMGLGPENQDHLWIVAPENVAAEIDEPDVRILTPKDILDCVDVGKLVSEYNLGNWDRRDQKSGHAILGATLLQKLVDQREKPKYDLLISGKGGVRDVSLEWLSWYAATNHPMMMTQSEFSRANEGIVFSAANLERFGEVGKVIQDLLMRRWLGSSTVVIDPTSLERVAQATSMPAAKLIMALGIAELAKEQKMKLIEVSRAYPPPNTFPDKDDVEYMIKKAMLDALTEGLISRNVRLNDAKKPDLVRVNDLLNRTAISIGQSVGNILPPVSEIVDGGYLNEEKARQLIQREFGKRWFMSALAAAQKDKSPIELNLLAIAAKLVPDHNPVIFGELILKVIERSEIVAKQHAPIFWGDQVAQRPLYSLFKDGELDRLQSQLANLLLYNQPIGDDGAPHPYDIMSDDMQPIRNKVEQEMREANVRVLVPFAGEEESIAGVLRYCSKAVGTNKVIAIDAGRSETSTLLAVQSGVTMVNESEAFAQFQLDKLKEAQILPENFELKGSKSLTLLAGLFELEKQYQRGDINDDTMIIFHDSDITNPEEYAGLHYLFLPMIFYPEGYPPRSVHMAKTGKGRNNEPLFSMISDCMNSQDEEIEKLGYSMAGLIWPLAGERAMRWKDLRKCIWSNAMGIETLLDVQLAGMDTEDGKRLLFQVANRIPKSENRPSLPHREMGMIMGLERLFKDLKTAAKAAGDKKAILPHNWNLANIALYNQRFGGETFAMAFGDNETSETQASYIQQGIVDFILPSIEQMVNNGYLVLN